MTVTGGVSGQPSWLRTGWPDPGVRLGSLRARQRQVAAEMVTLAGQIDDAMADLVASGVSQAEVARMVGLSRQEVTRRLQRRAQR